jgi:hypothetical protein
MLDRAAAADAKMLAEGRDPFRARRLDRQQAPAIGMMTGYRRHLDGFAAKRVRHVHALAVHHGNAVAAMTDMVDDETLNHGARR